MTDQKEVIDNEDPGWMTWERKTALKGIAAAVLTFPFAVLVTFNFWPVDYSSFDRQQILLMSFQWLPLIAAFLFFMFTRTARLFDTKGAEQVLEGLESRRWKIDAKIYQNTVEQCALFLTAYIPLATVVPAAQAQILPSLVSLWFFGRICFYVAYHINPAYRAFGFDYTIFPSLLALAWFLIQVF